jgi:hypothetical protein
MTAPLIAFEVQASEEPSGHSCRVAAPWPPVASSGPGILEVGRRPAVLVSSRPARLPSRLLPPALQCRCEDLQGGDDDNRPGRKADEKAGRDRDSRADHAK